MTPHLLEVAVEGQLLLVRRLHLGAIPDDPDSLLEPVLQRLGRHDCNWGVIAGRRALLLSEGKGFESKTLHGLGMQDKKSLDEGHFSDS